MASPEISEYISFTLRNIKLCIQNVRMIKLVKRGNLRSSVFKRRGLNQVLEDKYFEVCIIIKYMIYRYYIFKTLKSKVAKIVRVSK